MVPPKQSSVAASGTAVAKAMKRCAPDKIDGDATMMDPPAKSTRFELEPGYRRVKRPCIADFSDVESGNSEIWLIQLPRQMPLQRLGGIQVQLQKEVAADTAGSIGTFKDAAGASYVVSQDVKSLAQQVALLAPDESGLAHRLPVVRRVTVSRDMRVMGDAGEGDGTGELLPTSQLYSDVLDVGQPQESRAVQEQMATKASAAATSGQETTGKKKMKAKRDPVRQEEPTAGPGPQREAAASKKKQKRRASEVADTAPMAQPRATDGSSTKHSSELVADATDVVHKADGVGSGKKIKNKKSRVSNAGL